MRVLLATAPRTSVEHSSQTKSRLTGQGTVRLPASGLSDSVMPNVVETFDKAFDVAEASAVSHFFLGSGTLGLRRLPHRLRGKRSGNTGWSAEKSLVGKTGNRNE